MKRIILLICIYQCHLAFSQAPSVEWQKCLGGSDLDYQFSIQQTTDGGYISTGYTVSNDKDVVGNHSIGGADFWVLKWNQLGTIEWKKCFGGISHDRAYSIQQTNDGGYIVAGSTASNDGDVSGNHGSHDMWILKLNSNGNIEWQKCLGGTNADVAESIQQSTDGGYIIAGYTESNDGDVTGFHSSPPNTPPDFWIVKLNNTGAIEWQKCLGGTYRDNSKTIKQTIDGGFIVAGTSNSIDGDVSGQHGLDDVLIIKLNYQGTIQWQKCIGGTSSDGANSIQQTIDGGYVLVGYTQSNDGDVLGQHYSFTTDIWVVKLNNLGVIEWQKCLGGTYSDSGSSIQQTIDGGYIIAGFTESNDGDVIGKIVNGGPDFWIVKLNNIGAIEWQKCLGGKKSDYATCIYQTNNSSYIVAGYTDSNDGNVSGNNGKVDFWIVKLSTSTLSNTAFETAEKTIFSPNPSQSSINFSQEIYNLSVFDIVGKKVKSFTKSSASFDISNLEKGIYLLKGTTIEGESINDKLIKN